MNPSALARRRTGVDPTESKELTARQKVAVLFMTMDEEDSARVLRNLPPDDVEAISYEIARMDKVDPAVVRDILREWSSMEEAASLVAQGGVDLAKRLLQSSFGSQKASNMLQRIEAHIQETISLSHLRKADPQQLIAYIRNEHPQTIALILAYLDPGLTASVVQNLDADLSADALFRIARMQRVLPDVLRAVDEVLRRETSLGISAETQASGGPALVAEILNQLGSGSERELFERIESRDAELSVEIKNLMFVFEDILKLDDRAITRIVREAELRDLALSLKMASEEVEERVRSCMTTRAREALTEEMEFLGSVRLAEVEAAQVALVRLVRRLEDEGEIVIVTEADDVLVG